MESNQKAKRHLRAVCVVVGLLAALKFWGPALIIGGATTGVLAFASFWMLMNWFPAIKTTILKFGEYADVVVTIGVMVVVGSFSSTVTTIIGGATFGLLFTLTFSLSRLGGVSGALNTASETIKEKAKEVYVSYTSTRDHDSSDGGSSEE